MSGEDRGDLKLTGERRSRVLRGHPWVYLSEVRQKLPPEFDGQGVVLRDARGNGLGTGVYNGLSQICWRRFSRKSGQVQFDREFLRDAIDAAIERRQRETPGPFRRLVWSDADFVPGLITDQFDDVLVVQAVTRAVDLRLNEIAEILGSLLNPSEILFRNDAPVRRMEGLERQVHTRSGEPLSPRWFKIDGVEYLLDLEKAQKTGYYLDQRANHLAVSRLARGRRVLDAFCNQGSFALQCARQGATEVTAVDSSEECARLVKLNAERNELRVEGECANFFDWIQSREKRGAYDLIVLDPPSFARNRKSLEGAIRGYTALNAWAMRALANGGLLATFSCSQHVDGATFEGIMMEAASRANREAHVIRAFEQPPDHPVLVNLPESRYLRGCLLEMAG